MTSYYTVGDDEKTPKIWGREPALFTGLITAGVTLAAAFGFELDGEQVAGITVFTTAVMSFITRRAVTPAYNVTDGHTAGEEHDPLL